ncbi:aKG-HExxH-type peptide beta-hydroxylase [Geopseudomonas aromaticivorans]
MNSSSNHIFSYIKKSNSKIWWPGLAEFIISNSASNKYSGKNYSTASVISGKEFEPYLTIPISAISDAKLEFLYDSHAQLFAQQKVNQVSIDRFSNPETLKRIESAFALIDVSPTLKKAIDALVKSIHVIDAEPGYDVSFTDPGLAFSIFVSVPADNKNADLRLAESIIHEAMHLQLSALEGEIILVHDEISKVYSPWKKMPRPISGIMHALYVFSSIKQWLEIIKDTPFGHEYSITRIREIREDLDLLEYGNCYDSLTDSGKFIFKKMISILKG